ncbi:hypothetical protein C0J52_03733 [Blattella germanica]|nr:hypothetical protein C0J52_03733 [Blattella germanica]
MYGRYLDIRALHICALVLLVLPRLTEGEKCGVSLTGNNERILQCPVRDIEPDDGPCEMRNVELQVIDAAAGEVGFKFNVTSKSCDTYRFELSVNDTVLGPRCLNTPKKYFTTQHSTLQLLMHNNHTIGSCKEILNVTFNEVQQGCYKLFYCAVKVSSNYSKNCQQLVKYLNTTFIPKPPVEYIEPKLTPFVLDDRQVVTILITNYTRLSRVDLQIDRDTHPQCEGNTDRLEKALGILERNENGELMCSRPNISCMKNDQELRCLEIDCSEEKNETINCRFFNVPPGNYCVHMSVMEPPKCPESSVCHYYQTFHVSEISRVPDVGDEQISVVYVILAIAVCFLLITSFVVVVIIFRRRWNNPGRVIIPKDDQSLLECPEILLLYPYDCKVFMEAMVTFRKVLEEKTGGKVYDCFDPSNAEELSMSKIDWMRRHISWRSMKILVIESAAAVLHQKALLQSTKVAYREPMWLDGLFLYALKALTDDIDSDNYERVFVVRKSRRNLLTISIDEDRNMNLLRLQQDIETLRNYKRQNPNYLQDMLYTS